jgi:hypothetical protein
VAQLVELVDPGRSVVYLARRPFTDRERSWLAVPRHNLLVELKLAPRSAALGLTADPFELIRSARGLDPAGLHWMVGPLTADGRDEAARLLAALPRRSRLTLLPRRPGPGAGPASDSAGPGGPAGGEGLARLEEVAHGWGHTVSDWTCRGGLARVGRGFFEVDRLTGQRDLVRRAHDLITCSGCPCRTQCHGPLDEAALSRRLPQELQVLGLDATSPPTRTGPRSLSLEVAQPVARGDEVFLSHALGQPVAIALTGRGRRPADAAGPGEVAPAVLRRWYRTGFLPVTELNSAAGLVLDDLRRFQEGRGRPVALAEADEGGPGAA